MSEFPLIAECLMESTVSCERRSSRGQQPHLRLVNGRRLSCSAAGRQSASESRLGNSRIPTEIHAFCAARPQTRGVQDDARWLLVFFFEIETLVEVFVESFSVVVFQLLTKVFVVQFVFRVETFAGV